MKYILKTLLFCIITTQSIASSDEIGRDIRTNEEWKEVLTPNQFYILRQNGTEPPYSSSLNYENREGVFACVACGLELFKSETKYDSGTGWPSFWDFIPGRLKTKWDWSLISPKRILNLEWPRVEYHCARCDGHHGHVFEDGPEDKTGLRYCNNGVALVFIPAE